MSRRIAFVLLWLLLAGCEPEATPFPVDLPTDTPPPASPAPIRYALAANTAGTVADMTVLERGAQITILTDPVDPATLGQQFDLIAAYGTYADAMQSPISIHYTLLLNTALPPLDTISGTLVQSIDPASIVDRLGIPGVQPFAAERTLSQAALRTALANNGWPDGVDMLLAHGPAVGLEALVSYFARSGIRLNAVPSQDNLNQVHLALVTWATEDERQQWVEWAGPDSQAVDLFTLPISYWTAADLVVTFSPQGWPLPAPG